MSKAIENLRAAQARAMRVRPAIGGFPYLAEALRQAGVIRNEWTLPTCQSLYETTDGSVVQLGQPVATETTEVPSFDREALIRALRADQEGRSVFPQFLTDAWNAGVIRYEVDFAKRHVRYFGAGGETYVEDYPRVDLAEA